MTRSTIMSSFKSAITALLLINSSAYALDPVQGFYGGLFVGGSYTPNVTSKFYIPQFKSMNSSISSATLSYQPYINGGGQVGYRFDQFRAELEPFVNYSPYSTLTVNGTKIHKFKKKFSTPNMPYLQGRTSTGALMVNGYYDLFDISEQSNYVPFVGFGVGYATVQNTINFYNTLTPYTKSSDRKGLAALQGIIGVNYFMDDFTAIGLDFRYFTTQSGKYRLHSITQSSLRTQFATLNLSVNGAFDCG